MPYLSTKNSKIFYTEYGNGNPVVLLHGNNEDYMIFKNFIDFFADHCKIYAFDTPYHGKSISNADISYSSFAQEITEAILLLDINSPSIVGYSDGGIIGLIIALNNIVKLNKLVTIGANFNPSGLKTSCINSIKAEINFLRGIKKQIAEIMLVSPNITPEELSAIVIPVLVIAGERDVIKSMHTKTLAQSLPKAAITIIKNAGHFLLDNADCFSAIDSFLIAESKAL